MRASERRLILADAECRPAGVRLLLDIRFLRLILRLSLVSLVPVYPLCQLLVVAPPGVAQPREQSHASDYARVAPLVDLGGALASRAPVRGNVP